MPSRALALALLCGPLLVACASSDPEPKAATSVSAEAPPGEEAPTEPAPKEEAPSEPAADDAAAGEAPTEAPGDGTVTVTRLSGTDSAPAMGTPGAKAKVTATVEGELVRLALAEFVTYCAPAPAFTAQVAGGTLVVRATPPENPSRCVGPHSAVLQLRGVPDEVSAVSVRNTSDEEVAKATIPRT